MSTYLLEVVCYDLEAAINAERNGADRIELCADQSAGGITPSPGVISEVLKHVNIPVFLMIRPRGGNFIYSDAEFEAMKIDIQYGKSAGVHGFVFGILDYKNHVDVNRNKELVRLAAPLPCTFHRAFDTVFDPVKSLEIVINAGFTRILTSAGKTTAREGISDLKLLIAEASGRIIIMPGGGVRQDNIDILKSELNVFEFHSSHVIQL